MSEGIWTLVLCLSLLGVCWFDWRHGIIPDWLNLVLLSFGVLRVWLLGWSFVFMAVLAVAVAVATFMLVRRIYFHCQGVDGLGLGDVKFFGALAPWVGLTGLPTVLLAGSVSGLVFVAGRRLFLGQSTGSLSLAFGPHLAIGAMTVWFFGPLG